MLDTQLLVVVVKKYNKLWSNHFKKWKWLHFSIRVRYNIIQIRMAKSGQLQITRM